MTPDATPDDLFGIPKTQYGSSYEDHLLEQYKLAVEMADNISARRGAANEFFLAVSSVLGSLAGIAAAIRGTQALASPAVVILGTVGIIFSAVWLLTLWTYRVLSAAKWKIINRLESRLPVAPFTAEWTLITQGYQGTRPLQPRYRGLAAVESWIPIAFVVLYLVLLGTAIFP